MKYVKKLLVDNGTKNYKGHWFSDGDVWKYVCSHLHWWERFDSRKVTEATLIAFNVFLEEGKLVSKRKNWKFFDKDVEFEWLEK